jgi:nitrogen-specific signal transduction histidine kinase
MQKPRSSAELRCSLHHAVECAERALASERRESLEGIRIAFAALQDAVEAVDAARLELFDISPRDQRELRDLVQRVQSLVGELLLKVEDWQPPDVPAPQPRAARAASPRWLN